jgi:hypothetical protein
MVFAFVHMMSLSADAASVASIDTGLEALSLQNQHYCVLFCVEKKDEQVPCWQWLKLDVWRRIDAYGV